MSMWQLIRSDIIAWKRHGFGNGQPRVKTIEAIILAWRYAGIRATILYRMSQAARRNHLPVVPQLLWLRCIRRYGLDIVPSINIGPGLYIAHPVGTVIMADRIGSNLSITTSVTVGLRVGPRFPRIGNDVTLGAGARVLGEISIGDGATVGANAVVMSDVPAGATAVGIPARIIFPKDAPQVESSLNFNGHLN